MGYAPDPCGCKEDSLCLWHETNIEILRSRLYITERQRDQFEAEVKDPETACGRLYSLIRFFVEIELDDYHTGMVHAEAVRERIKRLEAELASNSLKLCEHCNGTGDSDIPVYASWNPAKEIAVEQCPHCQGEGWYIDHAPECYESGDCVNCGGVQVQCSCNKAEQ